MISAPSLDLVLAGVDRITERHDGQGEQSEYATGKYDAAEAIAADLTAYFTELFAEGKP